MRRIDDFIPLVLPTNWVVLRKAVDGVFMTDGFLRIMFTVGPARDGKDWLHLSVSRAERLPSWDDLTFVKDLFIGSSRTAYQVLPSRDKYVNCHPYVLHLWSCLEGDPLPDFTVVVNGQLHI